MVILLLHVKITLPEFLPGKFMLHYKALTRLRKLYLYNEQFRYFRQEFTPRSGTF